MPTVSIRIPQIGEGLQEARLVAVLKNPGDHVKRDEPIYQMETDKAVMDVESPHEGTLVEWLASPDEILAIGAEVARIEVGGVETAEPASKPALVIPPRTRAYAKEKGLNDAELQSLTSEGGKLMPADVDAFLAKRTPAAATTSGRYDERSVPPKQRVLNSRLVRATQLVVPGTISLAVNWAPIEAEKARIKLGGGEFQPSAFTYFAYAVARAVRDHPSMRTSIVGDETYRTYKTLSLGIAVSLPGDELVVAVIEDADALPWSEFATKARERIEAARKGQDQANEAVTLSLTNMQNAGLRDAVPVVVPPAVATLFLGEVYKSVVEEEGRLAMQSTSNIALTFDHRVLNGVGAAQFLNAVKANAESIAGIL